ncbi:MAG: nuclear transport factor 2 family protein [Chitinophagaceae bacterium]|nr:MAG: nuclear transport factor 2 family protein [Chitinophagaceae bacterium]
MSLKETILNWVSAFNQGDAKALESMYAENAINHQMPNQAVYGHAAIGKMFRDEFASAPDMHCIPLQIIEEGEWAVLEWRDPKNFGGCGFFHIQNGLIVMQRGYWDKLNFREIYGG